MRVKEKNLPQRVYENMYVLGYIRINENNSNVFRIERMSILILVGGSMPMTSVHDSV